MKCCAPVTGRALSWRADRTTDARCHRTARHLVKGKWFCYQHALIWWEHYRIVQRIRDIPQKSKLDYDG